MAPISALRAVASSSAKTSSSCKSVRENAGNQNLMGKWVQIGGVLAGQGFAAKLALAEDVVLYSPPQVSIPDPVPAATDGGILDIITDNPLIVAGVAALLAVPVGINAILNIGAGGGSGVKPTTPEKALDALEKDQRVILIDIRSRDEVKAQGSPDLRTVKRSAVSVPLTSLVKGEYVVDEKFAEKVAKIRGLSEESLVILLDSDGSESKEAAKVIEGVEKIYFVQGGAKAWAAYGAWKAPGKGLSLSLPDLKGVGSKLNSLAEDYKEAPSLSKAGIALGALAGAGLFVLNEAEVILEVAGLFAAGNFFLKLLFAESRDKTLKEVKEIVDEKVAIREVGSDLSKIAKAVVEDSDTEEISVEESAPTETQAAADSAKEAKEWIENWKAKN